jgi:hypothetical protein
MGYQLPQVRRRLISDTFSHEASPFMTMKYLSPLKAEEALRIQQEVDFD